MGDAWLMARAMVMGGRAPGFEEYFGRRRRRSRLGFGIHSRGDRVMTSEVSSAEQFEQLVAAGWAVRGEA